MSLFMPIQPEPASRIYSGRKVYELRKFRPPTTGKVYLYETKDETATIQGIRGAFYFSEFLDLPLEQLWSRVGERATSRERFLRYFGPKHSSGIALAIERAEILERTVTLSELRSVDPSFDLPRGLWTYHQVPDETPAIRFLEQIPRKQVITHPEVTRAAVRQDLGIAPLATDEDAAFFTELYNLYVKPNYPESEDYADFVLGIHRSRHDPLGYFTKAKTIWVLRKAGQSIGYTVATEKRGGSIKFGPTVLAPQERGKGVGTEFRLLVESKYPAARKSYNTLPDDNLPALRYVIRAGYQIEAHLQNHYVRGTGEIVVGKMLQPPSPPALLAPLAIPRGALHLTDASTLPKAVLAESVNRLIAHFYDEVDDRFVEGLIAGMQGPFALSRKSKRVLLAVRGRQPAGLLVATPKRGGSLKCSPLVLTAEDPECLRLLLQGASQAFAPRVARRRYTHLPLLSDWLVRLALREGFRVEGVLRQPYRPGLDLVALGEPGR